MKFLNAEDRRKKIMELLQIEVTVETNKLSKLLNVTPMTIRRDFEYLEKKGLITTIYGGAIINTLPTLKEQNNMTDTSLEKRNIAKECAKFIKEGSTVLLDAGSSVKELAMEIIDIPNITVLTNSILVMNVLAKVDTKIRLIMIPGQFRKSSMSFFGSITNNFLNSIHVDYSFIGAMGVSERGASVLDMEEGQTKSKMIEISDNPIILADHTKIGVNSLFFIDVKGKRYTLVTNSNADKAVLKGIKKNGNHVITV
ncbi:putative aga operon transcriptional repressor [[Clostridium] ultunense Esp]|uniref:Putative aga operon transcriptional repressor n=1 Tax=[Clostridium] ultunense Esp TaxID=1288971 RepID=M1ZBG2_9FIRM|nr:putative aga operon transcriptional repressor [[Clostridium] ultunense Esp]SHD76271.1 putative aga operon transcriptional repressor [[Clostridium] ultunense Esp]